MRSLKPILLAALLMPLTVQAEIDLDATASVDAETAAVAKTLANRFAGINEQDVKATPISGLYEISLQGQVFYSSADGRYLVQGTLKDLATGRDLTEESQAELRLASMSKLNDENVIVYTPKDGNVKHKMTVFTDISCGYCRKMHNEMDGYLAQGIEVRYAFFPRAGMGSAAAKEAESVWCSKNQQSALDDAKGGRAVPSRECTNPIAEQYQLGQQFGVRGTPAVLTENGTLMPGYRPPKQMRAALDADAAKAKN